jgi:pSer/pThr/pTyr-binding forkhead associated (FHA) protein
MPKLVVFRGDAVEAEVTLSGRTLRIGRDAQNDIVVNDAANGVSRFHAEIRLEGGIYTIFDLNSRNGIWVNRQRVPSAVLQLGSPVTIGGCELMLEDESGLSDLGEAKVVVPPVVAPVTHGERPRGPAPATAPVKTMAARAGNQRALLWVGAAVAVLAIGVTIALRSKSKEAAPIKAPPIAAPTANTPPAQPAPPVDNRTATQIAIDKHLADVVDLMSRQEFDAAIRDHLDPVLQLDPQNSEATRLKTQALEELAKIANAKLPAQPPKPLKRPEAPVVLVSGIPKLASETPRDYSDRAKRIQDKYAQGKRELELKQFGAAINSFMAVEQDLANYSDVRALLADATAQRTAAVREAMDSGAQNEAAGRFGVALQWYLRAQLFDPASAAAAEKVRTVRDRMVKDATVLLERADTLVTLRKTADALKLYQQIVDTLPDGLEPRDRALQKIKALK